MSNDAEKEERVRALMSLVPKDWDSRPLTLAHEIRRLLGSLKDEGTSIDSGGGDGSANLWVTVGGVEYYLTIIRSGQNKTDKGEEP